jgi:hypothetical protein
MPLWTPSLDGIPLPSRPFIQNLINGNKYPDSRNEDEKGWNRKSHLPQVDKLTSSSQLEIFESLLVIWRLKKGEEERQGDKVWRDHVRAWLVRIVDSRSPLFRS